jgi:hypothetical protein
MSKQNTDTESEGTTTEEEVDLQNFSDNLMTQMKGNYYQHNFIKALREGNITLFDELIDSGGKPNSQCDSLYVDWFDGGGDPYLFDKLQDLNISPTMLILNSPQWLICCERDDKEETAKKILSVYNPDEGIKHMIYESFDLLLDGDYSLDLIKKFYDKYNINVNHKKGAFLIKALQNDKHNIVHFLLDKGVNIDSTMAGVNDVSEQLSSHLLNEKTKEEKDNIIELLTELKHTTKILVKAC